MSRSRGVAAGVVVVVLWASAFPAIRVAAPELGAVGLSLARLVVASAALLVLTAWTRPSRPRRRDLPLIIAAGFFGMTAYQLLLNEAERTVPAGIASLVVSAAPLVSLAIACLFLGERITLVGALGSLVALGGVAVVCLARAGVSISGAIGLVIAATVAQGIYHPLTKPLLGRYSSLEVATYTVIAGTALSLPLLPWGWPAMAAANTGAWLAAIYLGLLPSALGFVLWGVAVRALPVVVSTSLLYLVPGVAVLIAFLWLGELPTVGEAVGGLVIVAGVVLLTNADRLARRRATSDHISEPRHTTSEEVAMNTVESSGSGSSSPPVRRRFPRGALVGAAAALAVSALLVVGLLRPDAAPASPPAPANPGSVAGAPNLPPGFTDTFTDRYVDVGGVRLHAVVGGQGRPLLLVHGWPQTWYAWRMLPALARDFQVVAVDQRGIGLSDKPPDGYDTGTQADDIVKLMDALGHPRFAVVGTDTGMPISYALAADHPDRVERLVVAEAVIAGVTPSPPLIGTAAANDQYWHIPFNRLEGLNEQLVKGREDVYFGAKLKGLPDDTIRYYVDMLRADPNALRGSFGQYRAFDATIAQNQQRKNHRLTLPVLAIGGEKGIGDGVGKTMNLVADNVQTVIIPGSGHWVAEQAPEQELAALTAFLAPYRG